MTFAAPNAHVRSILMNNLCEETIYNPSVFFSAPPWRLKREMTRLRSFSFGVFRAKLARNQRSCLDYISGPFFFASLPLRHVKSAFRARIEISVHRQAKLFMVQWISFVTRRDRTKISTPEWNLRMSCNVHQFNRFSIRRAREIRKTKKISPRRTSI